MICSFNKWITQQTNWGLPSEDTSTTPPTTKNKGKVEFKSKFKLETIEIRVFIILNVDWFVSILVRRLYNTSLISFLFNMSVTFHGIRKIFMVSGGGPVFWLMFLIFLLVILYWQKKFTFGNLTQIKLDFTLNATRFSLHPENFRVFWKIYQGSTVCFRKREKMRERKKKE